MLCGGWGDYWRVHGLISNEVKVQDAGPFLANFSVSLLLTIFV
jgi:hypothetical protein